MNDLVDDGTIVHGAGFAAPFAKPRLLMDAAGMRDAIVRKRDGEELTPAQWEDVIDGYVRGDVDEAQMAAMAMACVWRGLSIDEAAAMTRAMVNSGRTLQFPSDALVVDKHSSGGVSDIVSMIAVPVVAACGARVAKLSGRALGHTGGTIDKLETIPGFDVALPMDRFVRQVESVGCAIAAQSDDFVPADKMLYRLRDRTGTVPNLGLIASSIVSKKIAGGANAFVFDVKCGTASFMRAPDEAVALARALVDISARFDRPARAIVSDMNEPLGQSIGTGVEVIEARDFLRGERNIPRVRELCLRIADAMLAFAGIANGADAAVRALDSGAAYEKFVAMIEAQGGTRAAFEAMEPSPRALEVRADRGGYVQSIDAVTLGHLGRSLSDASPFAGVRVLVRRGDCVERDQSLAEICGANGDHDRLRRSFTIGDEPPASIPLIYATIV